MVSPSLLTGLMNFFLWVITVASFVVLDITSSSSNLLHELMKVFSSFCYKLGESGGGQAEIYNILCKLVYHKRFKDAHK